MNKRFVIWFKAIALAVVLAFGVLTVLIQKAQAYAYSGCKWPTNSPVYDGHALTSGWNTAVSNGRNQWNNVTSSPLNILRNDTSNNDVTVGNTGGLAGKTIRTCVNGTITDADIIFNAAFEPTPGWYTGTGSPGSKWDAWSVATHEFGHFIGFGEAQTEICGGSEDSRPTMCEGYSAGKTYKRSLEFDDINGLNVVYP